MRRLATMLLTAAAVGWGAAPALATAGDPVTGYWARTQTGLPLPVQPPTPVPEGGMWVAADPTGPVAVSALRAELAVGLVATELRLAVADAVGSPAVQVCPSQDSWAPDRNGRLEGAPVADCSAPLEGVVNGEVLVVKLPAGFDGVNVLLRPAPGAAFSLTLERPTAASVVTAPQPVAFDPSSAPPPAELSGPAFEGVALPPLAPVPAAAPPLAAPSVTPVVAQPAPAPQVAPAPVTKARAAVRPDDRRESLVAVAVLALLVMQAVRLTRQPAVAPRSLGGAARRGRAAAIDDAATPLATPRGVGRFRTVRPRPPVQI